MINHESRLLDERFFSLTIQTKRFLKPYLESLYGSPVIFNSNNLFGKVISGLLERPHKTYEKKEVLQFRVFDKLDTPIKIYLPKTWLKNYRLGHSLSNQSMLAFTGFFESLFEEDLYKSCEMGRIYKVQTKKALEEFCSRHNISIEEDITYDALKKKEYRFRVFQENLKNNPQELSLHNYSSKKVV